jgi:hypothetical protein
MDSCISFKLFSLTVHALFLEETWTKATRVKWGWELILRVRTYYRSRLTAKSHALLSTLNWFKFWWESFVHSHVTLVLVWPGHECWENSHENSHLCLTGSLPVLTYSPQFSLKVQYGLSRVYPVYCYRNPKLLNWIYLCWITVWVLNCSLCKSTKGRS